MLHERLHTYMNVRAITLLSVLCAYFLLLSPALASARSLVPSDSGNDVLTLQKALASQGYLAATPNGYFGVQTEAAVKAFQCAQNIICSGSLGTGYGVAGPKTQSTITTINNQSILTGVETPRATGKFEVSGWLPWYAAATSTADVAPHLSEFTSVMPFGYSVTTNGTLEDTLAVAQGPWPQFISQAKAQGVRVVPTVMWGNGTAEQAVLGNTAERQSLEDQIVNAVQTNNFAGIDIDFEAKTAETRDSFSTFLQELYKKMGNKFVYCTIEARMPLTDRYLPGSTIPSDATDYANDYVAMNKYCDRVEVMAYDQGTIDKPLNAVQTGPYAPVADPKWDADLVNLAAQTISRNKIILGIPTYGYEYTVTPVVGTGNYQYQYQVLWPFNPKYATDLASTLGISAIRNSAGELSFSYHSSGNFSPTGDENDIDPQSSFGNVPAISYTGDGSTTYTAPSFNFIDWSDATAVAQKVALAKSLGLRGVAVFSLNGGEDQNIWGAL